MAKRNQNRNNNPDTESLEEKLEEDIANLGDDTTTDEANETVTDETGNDPLVDPDAPVAPKTEEDLAAEKAQADADKAAAQAAADAKVRNAKTEVRDLEEKLEAARQKLSNAELDAAHVEAPATNRPCCLPQYDPTLRSARSSHQAHQMVDVLKRNNPDPDKE